MDYSPKLKKAMAEIKEITTKYDIGAFVLLSDGDGFSEYANIVHPSWSCIQMVERVGFRIRLKGAEVGKEKAKQLAEGTYNMINHFAAMLTKHAMLYMQADDMLRKAWGTSEGRGRDTSERDQNQ